MRGHLHLDRLLLGEHNNIGDVLTNFDRLRISVGQRFGEIEQQQVFNALEIPLPAR